MQFIIDDRRSIVPAAQLELRMKKSVRCCLRCRKWTVHVLRPASKSTSRPPFQVSARQIQATVLMAKARSLRQAGLSQTVSASGWGFLVQPLICQAPANTAAVSALAMLALSAAQKEKPRSGNRGFNFLESTWHGMNGTLRLRL